MCPLGIANARQNGPLIPCCWLWFPVASSFSRLLCHNSRWGKNSHMLFYHFASGWDFIVKLKMKTAVSNSIDNQEIHKATIDFGEKVLLWHKITQYNVHVLVWRLGYGHKKLISCYAFSNRVPHILVQYYCVCVFALPSISFSTHSCPIVLFLWGKSNASWNRCYLDPKHSVIQLPFKPPSMSRSCISLF